MYLACICAVGAATRKPNKIHITRKALVGPDRFCYDRLTTSRRTLVCCKDGGGRNGPLFGNIYCYAERAGVHNHNEGALHCKIFSAQ